MDDSWRSTLLKTQRLRVSSWRQCPTHCRILPLRFRDFIAEESIAVCTHLAQEIIP